MFLKNELEAQPEKPTYWRSVITPFDVTPPNDIPLQAQKEVSVQSSNQTWPAMSLTFNKTPLAKKLTTEMSPPASVVHAPILSQILSSILNLPEKSPEG
jgi:hypothetical protein